MNLKLVICVVLAVLATCSSKQHLHRSRRRAARDRIPYSSLSAGVIPSRVRSRLRTRGRQSSESGASRSGSNSRVVTNSDASSGSYASDPRNPQYGYPASDNRYGSQQQYPPQQSGGRQMVPVGTSTFPYATSDIYSGPSQNRFSSQQLPIPSSHRGGQAGYRPQQPSQYPPPVQQSYYSQQQSSRPGYAGGYPTQGNPYGGMSYGNPRNPQPQYPYGGYGQQPSYGGGGYADDSYAALGAIGSPYRDPYSRFTSYVHPQAEAGNRFSNPYGGSDSYYGSDAGSNYYGGGSSYQSSNVPASGSYGIPSYVQQDQQSNPYYGYGRSSAQSGVPSSGARDYGQSQDNRNPYGASGGNQYGYGSDASNSFGMGSQPTYDDTAYGQGNQYSGSRGSSMRGSISGAQSSNYPDYSGARRTGSVVSSQQQYGSSSSRQPSSRYSSQQIPSDSRVQNPTRNMHDPGSSDFSRGSSSYSRYHQAGQDDSSRNRESQRTSARYFNPGSTDAPTTTSHASDSRWGYQTGQRNPFAGRSPVFQQRNGGRVVTFSGTAPSGPLVPTRGSHVISPVRQQHNDTGNVISFHGSRSQHEQSGTYLVGSHGSGISLPRVASTKRSTATPAPPTPDTAGSLSHCQSKSNGLPDLALYPSDFKKDKSIFLDSRRREEILCAVNENCLSKLHPRLSRRLLLRFPTIVHNIGTADFLPDLPPQDWTYHTCHRHYHSMQEFAHFYLYNTNGTVVGEGHKVSFCLQDSGCKNPCKPKYNCTGVNERDRATQAISPGCYDDYKASLDCQWIDITSIPTNNKDYTLKIIVNPPLDGDRAVPEFSYTNNAVACKITLLSDTKLVVGRCNQV